MSTPSFTVQKNNNQFMSDNLTISEIIESFNQDGLVPIKEIELAIALKDEITPILLNLLDAFINNHQKRIFQRKDSIVALFLLSKFKEKKAFPYILRLAKLDKDWLEDFFGDFIDSFKQFIVSTYDGNLDAIKNFIEDRSIDPMSRSYIFGSFLGLFKLNIISRKELIEYARKIMNTDLMKDSIFSGFFLCDLESICPIELSSEIKILFEKKLIDTAIIDELCIKENFDLGIEQCIKNNIYDNKGFDPIEDVISEIKYLYNYRNETYNDIEVKENKYNLDIRQFEIDQKEYFACYARIYSKTELIAEPFTIAKPNGTALINLKNNNGQNISIELKITIDEE